VRLPEKVTALRLVVALTPHPDGQSPPRISWKQRALQDW